VNKDIVQWLAQVAPVALRVGGLLTFAPFFGDRAVPARIKAGLLIALTALLFPVVHIRPVSIAPIEWAQVAVGELLIGLLIGLSLQVVFEGLQFAGQMSGIQMGLSVATLFDPQSEADSTVLPVFYNIITLLIFLQLDVHHWVLRGLERSFEYLPVGSVVVSPLLSMDLVRVLGALFVLGVQIAAPILLATLMIDVVMSFISRASPQLPAMLLGIPVKNMTGCALLMGAVALWPGILESRFAIAIGAAEKMLHLIR
jgi:flagellar biosynthesis protein FliR